MRRGARDVRRLGDWNGHGVFIIRGPDIVPEGVRWEIRDRSGVAVNWFESAASFGHWVAHSGWRAE